MDKLTHFKDGNAVMVDISEKTITARVAVAKSLVKMNKETYMRVKNGEMKKGDVLGVARVAGIMGAKQTFNLIPMCHPLMLTGVEITFELDDENSSISIFSTVKTCGNTGVEMEALTASTITALTIYDMCKAMDKSIEITETFLLKKTGGKSGDWTKNE